MRRLPPLFTTPKSPPPSPKVTVKSGPHSDALWRLYNDLLQIDPSPDCPEGSTSSSGSVGVYYTTDTILDLDADNSPATRPYTSTDHAQQIAKWGTNHALDSLTKRMHAFRDEISDAKLAWRRKLGPFDARRITERDILVTALLGLGLGRPLAGPSSGGDGTGTGTGNGSQLSHEFLERIGISRRITGGREAEDIPLTVRYLAHRARTQRTQGQGQGQHQHQHQVPTNTQSESPPSADLPANPEKTNDNASASTGPSRAAATVQPSERKKPKTKAQELKHLKSVLRKSSGDGDAQSIPRVLYPLLNNDHARTLLAECHREIISGLTTKTKPQPQPQPPQTIAKSDDEQQDVEQQQETTTTQEAAIFLKNLAYNLLKRGDLALSADLRSVWAKIADYKGGEEGTLPATDSAGESPIMPPDNGTIAPDVDAAVERASSRCATAGIEPEPEPQRQGPVLAA